VTLISWWGQIHQEELSDTEIFEVIQLADQYCLPELVTASEVQLSDSKVTHKPKLNSKPEVMLDELVGQCHIIIVNDWCIAGKNQ